MGTYCFGIDVGGTTVKCGLFRTDGTLVEKWEIPTRKENNGDQILPDVAAAVNAKIEEKGISKDDVEGVGIGVPGPVNSKGEVDRAVNLYWGYKDVAGEMEELTGLPAKAGNDANVAALGEAWKGAAAGSSDVIMVTLGTGVGGGIIVDGKIVTGHHGAGGEIGHANVDHHETESSNCGNKAVWSSLPLQPELSVWQKKSLQFLQRRVYSEMWRIFPQKQFWMRSRRMIQLQLRP